jgi:hypothetical protein
MKTVYQNKLIAYRTLIDICNHPEKQLIWRTLPAFVACYELLCRLVKELEEVAISLEHKGAAATKAVSRAEFAARSYALAAAIRAHAARKGAPGLIERVKFSKSRFTHPRAVESVGFARNVLTAAQEHVHELADYGITPDTLREHAEMMKDFEAIALGPRVVQIKKSTQFVEVERRTREIDALLRLQMDGLVEQFRANHGDFVSVYFSARKVVRRRATRRTAGENEAYEEQNGSNPPSS